MLLQGCMQTSASRDQLLSWLRSASIVREANSRVQFKESMGRIMRTNSCNHLIHPVRFVPS